MNFKLLDNCLACSGEHLYEYLNLGEQPLANSFGSDSGLYPLKVNVCLDCWHSQLSIAVDRELLFDNYMYVSGTSNSLGMYFKELSSEILAENGDAKNILDIACNDGTFLDCFSHSTLELFGIDPARNLRTLCLDKGINITTAFFPHNFGRKFDIITALNVIAHVASPFDFLVGCKDILSENGKVYLQTSQRDMVVNGEFDTVYHEHHSFFTPNSMKILAERAGLCLVEVRKKNVHGGSYLFVLTKQGTSVVVEDSPCYKPEIYTVFQEKVDILCNKLLSICNDLRDSGYLLVGYGAAAKSVVALNFSGVTVDYIVDDNKFKIGTYIPGTYIPVKSKGVLESDDRKKAVIVFAWNMFDEIAKKVSNSADILIKPMPNVEVINVTRIV